MQTQPLNLNFYGQSSASNGNNFNMANGLSSTLTLNNGGMSLSPSNGNQRKQDFHHNHGGGLLAQTQGLVF